MADQLTIRPHALLTVALLTLGPDVSSQCTAPWCNPGPVFTPSAGTMAHPTYFSTIHDRPIGYRIYLPASYASQPLRTYPVIFILPGWGSTEIWSIADAWLVSGMTSGAIPECVMVHLNPIGNSYWHDDATCSGTTDPVAGYSTVMNEMLAHLEATYRIGTLPSERALIGFSMGGYGAMNLALRSGAFGTVLSVDGSLRVPGNESDAFKFSCAYDPATIAAHNVFTVLGGNIQSAVGLRTMVLVASPNYNDHFLFHQALQSAGAIGPYEYLPGVPHEFDAFVALRSTTMLSFLNASVTVPLGVRLLPAAFLQGAMRPGDPLMTGALSELELVPMEEPYAELGYLHVNGGGEEVTDSVVLGRTGPTAVVDWVVVELRDTNAAHAVLASCSALLLRNGSVVDADGGSALYFPVAPGAYHIALLHRNHLRVCSAVPFELGAMPLAVDLSSPSLPLAGGVDAGVVVEGRLCLWAGDVDRDGQVKYTGAGNDRDRILTAIGGATPTTQTTGYYGADVNLDGLVRYTGAANDRDIILSTIGGSSPTNVRSVAP